MSKRVANSQLTKDNAPASESDTDSDAPTSARAPASQEVMATRKIVSVRRSGKVAEKKDAILEGDEKTVEPEAAVKDTEPVEVTPPVSEAPSAPVSLFAGLTGLIAPAPEKPSTESKPLTSLFGNLGGPSDMPSLFSGGAFSFAPLTGDSSTAFPSFGESPEEAHSSSDQESGGEPSSPSGGHASVGVVDHSEDEEQVYQTDCKLFKLMKEEDKLKWTEKGIGFVRLVVNKNDKTKVRLVVRMKGVFRLMLNVALLPSLAKIEKVGSKSVKFTAMDENDALSDFRVNLLTDDQQTKFIDAIAEIQKAIGDEHPLLAK